MGRAKLKMEYIMKEKSRHLTFKKRKEGLVKKIKEFTTLCDVRACMIVYGAQDCSPEPLVWPENNGEVKRIINVYRNKNKSSENNVVGLADFLKDRSKKIEEELSKLQESNMEANYYTSAEFMNSFTENQLRGLSCELSNKIDVIDSLIEMIKVNSNGMMLQQQTYGTGMEFMNYYQPIASYNPLEMQPMVNPEVYNTSYGFLEQKPMEPRTNWPESQYNLANNMQQFGGVPNNNDVHFGSFMQQMCPDMSSQGVDNVLYDNNINYLRRNFTNFTGTQQSSLPYMLGSVAPASPLMNGFPVNHGLESDHCQSNDGTRKY